MRIASQIRTSAVCSLRQLIRVCENQTGRFQSDLSAEVMAAYDAPFPNVSYQAGARIWPSLVPTGPDDPEAPANSR